MNKRLLEERNKQAAWREKSARGGRKGGADPRGLALRRMRNSLRGMMRLACPPEIRDADFDLTLVSLGYTMHSLGDHLESQFDDKMTWENYGEWQVDHFLPRSSFDLTDPAEFQKCWHLENLRPLSARENASKGGQIYLEDSQRVVKKRSNQKLTLQSLSLSLSIKDMSKEVFQHWKTTLNHPKAILDAKRQRLIAARLEDGYSVDDLKVAIDGNKASPYHQGENDQHTVYDSLELILRDAEHVDQFIAKVANRSGGNGTGAHQPPIVTAPSDYRKPRQKEVTE